MAINYGRNICACLDPDGNEAPHDACYIEFSDVDALGTVAKEISRACSAYESSIYEMSDRSKHYQNIMQDNVIAQTVETMGSVCEYGEGKIEELGRIIGGVSVTQTTLKSAEEMLQMAEDIKTGR